MVSAACLQVAPVPDPHRKEQRTISPSGLAGFNPDDLGHSGFLLPDPSARRRKSGQTHEINVRERGPLADHAGKPTAGDLQRLT